MKTKRNRKRKTKRGGMWSWPWSTSVQEKEEDITEEEANSIALQIKQNVIIGPQADPIPKHVTTRLFQGKDSKKIKLALTKVLPLNARDQEKFDFFYYTLERSDVDGPNERLRLFNADMEADEIMDYVQKGVRRDGIRYILGRSQNVTKLESALKRKVAMLDPVAQEKFTDILMDLNSKKVAEADNKILSYNSRWTDK